MVRKIKRKKYKQSMIHSSEKLNSNLAIIKYYTRKSPRIILEEIVNPLAQILANKREPNGYWVSVQNDTINIQCFGVGNIVQGSKLTSVINDTIRIS
jgi:hypothetical protein